MTLVLPVFSYRPPTLRLVVSGYLVTGILILSERKGPRLVSTPGNSWWGCAPWFPKAWFSYAADLPTMTVCVAVAD